MKLPLFTLVFLALLGNLSVVTCFNIDLNNSFIYSGKQPGSFFGYSLAISKELNAIIVGAPKGNEYKKSEVVTQNDNWGSVYSCVVTPGSTDCELLNKVDDITKVQNNPGKKDQWMGATVYSDHKNVLSCAPRFNIPNTINNEIYYTGKCDFFNAISKSNFKDYEFKPCEQVARSGENGAKSHGMCEAGFSANIIPVGNDMNVGTGLFTTHNDKGEIFEKVAMSDDDGKKKKIAPTTDLGFFDYMGYAITTGKFKKDKGIFIVGGAPRGNQLKGKVIMYDSANPNLIKFSSQILSPSEQVGSYFGASLGAADINGDGFSDLVVGAPHYANTRPNQGAIFVYLNDQNDGLKFTDQQFYGTYEDGFFGYSIGSVGDLNKDGKDDIAVGAPWAGDNNEGVVYLYYGTGKDGQPLAQKQIIMPKDIKGGASFLGFGFSFADFYQYSTDPGHHNDLDENKYNDLAIGAFKSGHVALLRARPVVTIKGELKTDGKPKIDLSSKDPNTICKFKGTDFKCIKGAKVCFQVEQQEDDPQNVKYSIEVDAQTDVKREKRGFLADKNGDQVYQIDEIVSAVGKAEKCTSPFDIFIKNNTKNVLNAFRVTLKWEYEAACKDNDICPVSNKMEVLTIPYDFPYLKGCSDDGNEECNVDLQLTMEGVVSSGGKNILLGVTKTVTLVVDVKNVGENSFLNTLKVTYPKKQVSPNKVTIASYVGLVEWLPGDTEDSDIKSVIVTLSSPIKQNGIDKVSIVFSVLNVGRGKDVVFNANVTTQSTEMKPADNVARVDLPVTLNANLTVSGSVKPENVKWEKGVASLNKVGPTVTHTFYFQNMGPSAAEESDVLIKIPEKMGGNYILNIVKVTLIPGIGYKDDIGKCEQGTLNPLNLDLSQMNITRRRRRREVSAPVIVDCGSNTGCMIINCKLNRLGKSQNAQVTVTSTLVEATFDKLKESRQVVAFAKFSSEFVKRARGAEPDEVNVPLNVNTPYLKVEKQGEPIAWWIILLCILGAVLIIGLIVFILYKKGFFKRKKHGEEEEEGLRKGDPDDDY
eukprot:TCONS_00011678-protein